MCTLVLCRGLLGLELHLRPGAPVREALHFYDLVRGEYLWTYEAEVRLREERAVRQVLEAELWELRQCGG